MRHYATYFDSNYIPQGLALHDPMMRHCQPFKLHVLALDEFTEGIVADLPNIQIVPLEAVLTDRLRAARAGRSHREQIWTLTPGWMIYCLGIESVACLNYIDADCFFFDSPDPVFNEIGDNPIAITPHRFPKRAKHFESNGLYNVGLVHVKRGGLDCLREWEALCIEQCLEDGVPKADQGYWDDLVPKYGAHVIEHLGANLAPWNQEAYQYRLENGKLTVNGEYLLWYHAHQGLEPKWPIHLAVQNFVYPRYAAALRRAERMLLWPI